MPAEASEPENNDTMAKASMPRRSPLWQGVTTEVLNPKLRSFFSPSYRNL
jgi:threonine/homoserine/homoserine lactone efflux protein